MATNKNSCGRRKEIGQWKGNLSLQSLHHQNKNKSIPLLPTPKKHGSINTPMMVSLFPFFLLLQFIGLTVLILQNRENHPYWCAHWRETWRRRIRKSLWRRMVWNKGNFLLLDGEWLFQVALKLMSEFASEAKILENLRHPNILNSFGVFQMKHVDKPSGISFAFCTL